MLSCLRICNIYSKPSLSSHISELKFSIEITRLNIECNEASFMKRLTADHNFILRSLISQHIFVLPIAFHLLVQIVVLTD